MARTTTRVIQDHLMKRLDNRLEDDIRDNYHKHVVILSGFGTYRGHDGVRQSARLLREAVAEDGCFDYNRTVIEGKYGFLEWTASAEDTSVRDGADSYHMVDGLIVMQTIHYTTWPRHE